MSAPSQRLGADEVVERGLRLYAQGDLEGAVAEWRRALEIDGNNRRGRDYLVYVEEHFKVLSEKFRAARARHGVASGSAIEMEADDPQEDIDPYESIELQGQPTAGRATVERTVGEGDEVDAEAATAPAPSAPHLRDGAPVGKHAGGRRPWGGRRPGARDPDDMWPTDESWPPVSRNDTLEMSVDPSLLDDLEDLAAGDIGESPFDDEEDDAEDDGDVVLGERMLDSQRIEDLAAAEREDEEAEAETGEITWPARRRQKSRSTTPAAQGSRPLENHKMTPGVKGRALAAEGPEANGFDLSDFGSSRGMVRVSQTPADEEAWADGTPPTEDVEDDALAQLRGLREEELREVRVTFRRPAQATSRDLLTGQHHHPVEPEDDDEEAADADEVGAEVDEDDDEAIVPASDRYRLEDLDAEQDDDLDGDDDEDDDEDERTQERRAHQPSAGAERRRPTNRHTQPAHARSPQRLSSEGSDLVASAIRLAEEQASTARGPAAPDSSAAQERPAGRHRRRGPALRAVSERDGESAAERATTELRGGRRPLAHSAVSIELVSSELLADLDRALQAQPHGADDLVRERVGWLIERARLENLAGHFPVAVVAVDLALDENPESAVAQKLIHSNRDLLFEIYGNYLGDPTAVPGLALPMSAIPMSELDHRAAFLLSRVDGVLSIEDVLDVAGMGRLEAFRHLSRLMLRGILEIRP